MKASRSPRIHIVILKSCTSARLHLLLHKVICGLHVARILPRVIINTVVLTYNFYYYNT